MERWKPICGYEDLYEISDHGNVRKLGSDSFLRQGDYHGYRSVRLRDIAREERKFRVHRLVAHHFLKPPTEDQTYVMHLDDVRSNNHYLNLRWGTPKDNALDTIRKGRHHNKQHQRKLDLSPAQIQSIRDMRRSGMTKVAIRTAFGEVDSRAMNRVFKEHGID